jgi:hypothetical protein
MSDTYSRESKKALSVHVFSALQELSLFVVPGEHLITKHALPDGEAVFGSLEVSAHTPYHQ